MSKFLFGVSAVLISISLFIISLGLFFPTSISSVLRSSSDEKPTSTESMIITDEYTFENGKEPQKKSLMIVGEEPSTPTPIVHYQQATPAPTKPSSGIPEGGWDDAQAPQNEAASMPYWSDFKDKEAYCRAMAESAKSDPSIEAIWRESYQQLLKDFADDPFSSSPLAAKPPTWEQFSNGYPEEVYNSVYRQCINDISQ